MSENAKKIACQVLEISGNELSDLMQPVLSPSLKSNQNIQNKKFEQVFSKKILEEENDECWKKTVDNITKRNVSFLLAYKLVVMLEKLCNSLLFLSKLFFFFFF